MNIFAVSGLINAISISALGVVVYFKNKTNELNIRYALFLFTAAFWSFCYFLLLTASDKTSALFWVRTLMAGAIFIPVSFMHFVLLLLGIYKDKRKILYIGYLVFIVFFLLDFTNLFIQDAEPKLIFRFWPTPGPLFGVFLAIWFCYCIYPCYLMFQSLKNYTGAKKQQIKYVLISILIGYASGSSNYFLFYDIPILPYGNLFVFLFVGIIAYAITQHRLFDINIVIRRTIIYSSLITILTVTYLLVVLVAERFSSHFFGYTTLPMTIVTASIIAIAFIPIKNKIQYIVDRLFFKGTLDSLAKEKALMHQELMRSERLKAVATLAAGMAHEIKNPLTAIKTFTEHLKEKKDDSEFIAKFERIVGGEVDKINDLVHSLLDFAKPNPLKFETSNINYLLEDTLSLLNNEIIKHKIRLVKKYSELPLIQADPNQLKQAFLNLILNAIEAMIHGGELTIETVRVATEEKLGVNIKDAGAGIPQKDLPRIFDPFYSTKNTGTGLGLSITYEIIKKHNGTITVESEAGRGTVVKIEF